MVDVEVCINAETPAGTRPAILAAYQGGAARVELCRAMELDGLTPTLANMELAREVFENRPGLVVMVRPRGGDFCFSRGEVSRMVDAIAQAAEAGADGVALGALKAGDLCVDTEAMERLVEAADDQGLRVTFHRAFDAAADPDEALETLAVLGVQRVLTAGIPWGKPGNALDGLPRLQRTLELASGRLEVVVAGGVNPGNAPAICKGLAEVGGEFSLHAYSGAQQGGMTTRAAVERLVRAANNAHG